MSKIKAGIIGGLLALLLSWLFIWGIQVALACDPLSYYQIRPHTYKYHQHPRIHIQPTVPNSNVDNPFKGGYIIQDGRIQPTLPNSTIINPFIGGFKLK